MFNTSEKIIVNNKEYQIINFLGKGKGGYSYLCKYNDNYYVLKQIHHEKCDYYQFGNKIESELKDYNTLKNLNIPMPELIDVDVQKEIIIKQYINGPTIEQLVKERKNIDKFLLQMRNICLILYKNNINIDYYPTNFVIENEQLFYIDYECNVYDEKWDFEHWGIKYWIIDQK